MCIETIEVTGVNTQRDAYEITETLKGVPEIKSVSCNFLDNTVTVDYNEKTISHEDILDRIEGVGCKPCERLSNGPFAKLKRTIGV